MEYSIIFIIPDIILILLFIKECISLRECKKSFICSNCNQFNNKIRHGDKCSKCHRTLKLKNNSWEHFMIFRYTYIDSNNKQYKFNYKSYKKWFILELIVCGIGILTSTIMVIFGFMSIIE